MEFWSFGVLKFWNFGVLELWSFGNFGVLEFWSIGVLEFWSFGALEFWSFGVLATEYCQKYHVELVPEKTKLLCFCPKGLESSSFNWKLVSPILLGPSKI